MILIFFVIYFGMAFIWPSIRLYRNTKLQAFTFSRTESAHDLIGNYMKILMIVAFYSSLSSLPFEKFHYQKLLEGPELKVLGWGMLLFSFGFILVAQWQMKNSWRIGIDSVHQTELQKNGLFGFTRNPIFLSMLTTLLGVFFIYSSILNLCIFISGYLLITIQIRLEEEFLEKAHGEKYLLYKSKVRRRLLL